MGKNWIPTTQAEAIARARGRRRYNSERHDQAIIRRAEMMRLYLAYEGGRGTKARIARELGVHPSTITRDFKQSIWVHEQACPFCGTVKDNKVWELQSFRTGSHSHDAYSAAGQAEIMASKVLIELLPMVLADLGFFDGDNGNLVNANDDDRDMGFTVSDLARRVMTAVDPHSAGLDVAAWVSLGSDCPASFTSTIGCGGSRRD